MERSRKPYQKGGYQQQQQQQPYKKPFKSAYGAPSSKSPITVITNDFRIKSRSHQMIYTYSVDFIEASGMAAGAGFEQKGKTQLEKQESMTSTVTSSSAGGKGGLETFMKFKIMNSESKRLDMIFEKHVFVGSNLFSTTNNEDEVILETKTPLFGRTYTIIIRQVASFNLDDLNKLKMEDHPVALNFINSVVKSCLRHSHLRQIGRSPLFFDPTQTKTFEGVIETWQGFFTSSWIFQKGLYLIVDNVSKFVSVQTCLDIIDERLQRRDENAVSYEFNNVVVMTSYGQQRTYQVSRIRWDMTPKNHQFEQGDQKQKTSMLDYFLRVYDIKIRTPNQPLLEVEQRRGTIYLPPELCTMVGIPANIRENKRTMMEIRKGQFQRPHERIASIQQLSKMISANKIAKEWDLQLAVEPDMIEAKILPRPEIYTVGDSKSGKDTHSLEDTRILADIVAEPIHFKKWTVFCLEGDQPNGQYLQDKMYGLSQSKGLNIQIEYADFVKLRNQSGINDFINAINSYYRQTILPDLQKKTKKASGTDDLYFFLIVIPSRAKQDEFYKALKDTINQTSPVISQFVHNRTIEKDNDRVYMNILRQINAKLGGDLWRMNFGPEISRKTMLVGIDVCHKGKNSFIGYVATYDPFMCKYYTQTDAQPRKGQELITGDILQKYFTRSFAAYKEYNSGELPEHIFIYRDGVGDAMRQQVLDEELVQLKKIIADEYGQTKQPEITLVFVNKRVRQRFFEVKGNSVVNPPQGTYVDSGFVEQEEVVDGKFDFFLIPHNVTQGAAKPTHFYVAENSSGLSKQAILDFTNALCYNYPNWADAIKVPAPCMLADRIAIYRTEIGSVPKDLNLLKLPFYL